MRAPTTARGPQLLSNKSQLVWGGVPLGRARQQNTVFKNVAEQMLKLTLEISAAHDNFQLLSLFGNKEKLAQSKEILLKPLESFTVHLHFAPTKVKGLHAKLIVRVVNSNVKYTIPMSGYGGISKLLMENVESGQNSNYWTNIGTPRSTVSSLIRATVRNVGQRAAYVKCLGFRDLDCKKAIASRCLTVQPEEFCVRPGESHDLRVILLPTEKDVVRCSDAPAIVGALALLYGDEVTRQQLRRSIQQHGKSCMKVPDNAIVKDVLFHVPFEGEENVAQGACDGITDTSGDVDVFYNTMSKMMLALVGQPEVTTTAADIIKPQQQQQQPFMHVDTHSVQPSVYPALAFTQPLPVTSNELLASSKQQQFLHSTVPLHSRANTNTFQTGSVSPSSHGKLSHDRYSNGSGDGRRLGKIERATTPTSTAAFSKYIGHSPPVRDDDRTPSSSSSLAMSVKPLSVDVNPVMVGAAAMTSACVWSVRPELLVLPAPLQDADPVIERLQLTNYTSRTLQYDLSWPAHYITVRPEQGSVAPHATAIVCVSANSLLRTKDKLLLPWAGHLHLTCNDLHQVVKVQILKGAPASQSPFEPATSPHHKLPTSNQAVATSAHPAGQTNTAASGKQFTEKLLFSETHVGKTAEAFMDVTNTSSFPVKWHLSSFTPPYFKARGAHSSTTGDAGDAENLQRVTYSVFWLPKHAGIIQPGEHHRVQICFQPRAGGLFAQHWELKTDTQGMAASHTQSTKYEFLAEAVDTANASNPPGISWANVMQGLTSTDTNGSSKDVIAVKSDRLVFPTTARRETQIFKIELKNRHNEPHRVTIVRPEPPFATQHSHCTIKSRHYVRIPVEFRPKSVGHYQGELVLKIDTGQVVKLTLIGQCQD